MVLHPCCQMLVDGLRRDEIRWVMFHCQSQPLSSLLGFDSTVGQATGGACIYSQTFYSVRLVWSGLQQLHEGRPIVQKPTLFNDLMCWFGCVLYLCPLLVWFSL